MSVAVRNERFRDSTIVELDWFVSTVTVEVHPEERHDVY